jgi:hypothetical protein
VDEDEKKRRELKKAADQKAREAKEAQRQSDLAKRKANDTKRRKLVMVYGIPKNIWDSEAQRPSIKESIVKFVDDVFAQPQPAENAAPLSRNAFTVRASFSEPSKAAAGACWLQFTYSDTFDWADMASWFVSNVDGHPSLPYKSMKAETWASRGAQ